MLKTQDMFVQQYYLECLSHASYLIGDPTSGRAVVIDPQRDVVQYIADAQEQGLSIDTVIETHFHADFLSGHLELAAKTGATIVYGIHAADRVEFPIRAMKQGEHINLGEVDLEILETPGHTPESISIVLRKSGPESEPYAVFTGDTLFIGDVGRPDLLSAVGFSADELAHQLYDSLHNKLMKLPDSTLVYPAHGAGSACGKNLSTETVSTIGEQRRTNYALAPMVVEDFIDAVTQGQSVAPLYFLFAANKNREAHGLLSEDIAVKTLTVSEVLQHQENGALVIDSRDDMMFAAGHLRHSINVGLTGRFAEYVGEVMQPGTPIILVTEPGYELEAKTRLGRIGFDNVIGALADPIRAFMEHPEVIEKASRLSFESFAERVASVKNLNVIDVRNAGEVALGTVPGSQHISLPSMIHEINNLDPTLPTVVFCAGGYRSSIAASLLRSHGFSDVSDLIGGYTSWSNANIPATLPTTTVHAAAVDTSSLLLDVRENDEWEEGHIAGAMHIPMAQLPEKLSEISNGQRIVVVCRSGNRSGKVTAWLLSKGVDAVNMTGGMLEWAKESLPIQSGK